MYRLLGRLIGPRARATYAGEYVRARPRDRILDVGCGPADILSHLPEVSYLGFDISPRYVEAARANFGNRGQFECRSISDPNGIESESFDLVLANGVLHHLPDSEAIHVIAIAHTCLRVGGRLVTLDGCFVPGQRSLARAMLRLDRGRYVRSGEAYQHLAKTRFQNVQLHIRSDLLRIPYTHAIMECLKTDASP